MPRVISLKRLSFSSVRVRTLILVFVAVVPALALMLYTASEQRRLDALRAATDAQRQAVLTAAGQAEEVIRARQLLELLARLPSVSAADVASCNDLLRGLLQNYPAYTNLTVMRPSGEVICSAPPAAAGLNFSDRAYFRRALATREFAAGDYIIGRITGKPTVDFAYPVVDANGKVVQVLALGIDLTWLNQSLSSGLWPPETTLTLVDQGGTIVGSYPDATRIGRSLRDRPETQRILGEKQGMATVAGPEGPMLVGFATTDAGTPAANLHVSIGVPEAVAYAVADRQLVRNVLLLSVAMVLILIAAWLLGDRLIMRPVKALVSAAKALSGGQLSARVGAPYPRGELGALGEAFDHMADALQAAYVSTVQVLASAIGARDPGGLDHVARVSDYAVQLGQALGWDDERLARLQVGAALHDVGKIGVPDETLRKQGHLDAQEVATVREHPVMGARMLATVPFLHSALDSVRSHHEFYDGTGYPGLLAGDAIPIEARIVAIADAYDSMTAPKPDGQGRSMEESLAELERAAGSQFDPKLVAAFVRAAKAGAISTTHQVGAHPELRAAWEFTQRLPNDAAPEKGTS